MPELPLAKLDPAAFRKLSERFKALGAPSRIKIIIALKDSELSVTDLVQITGLSQANLSQHLKILKNSGLIARRRAGTLGLYRIADSTLINLCQLVCIACQNRQE